METPSYEALPAPTSLLAVDRQDDIAARLARYAKTKDGRDLWPEVSVPAFRAGQEEIGRVTSAVLAGGGPLSLRLPSGVEPRALGVAAFAAGMGPLLGFWCETGLLDAEPAVASLLAAHLDHGRRRAERLGAELDRIVAAFSGRGIEALVLKGSHTARAYFPEPGTRPTADLDLLVKSDDRAAAGAALRDLGFAEDAATAVEARSHWIPPDAAPVRSLELTHADDPWSVDLHMSLDRQQLPGPPISLGRVEPSAEAVSHQFSRPIRVLAQPILLAYLALHASTHFYSMSLVRLVELVLVARRDFAGHAERWRGFADLLRRTATGRFTFPALDLAERLVPGSIEPLALEEAAAATPSRLRRRIRAMAPASAQQLHPYPLGEPWVWASSPRERFASALDIAWPRAAGRLVSPWKALLAHGRRLRRLFLGIARVRPGR
jgi:hypothetical protein